VSPRAAELKTLNQTARGQHLAGRAYDFGKTNITGKDTDHMSAPCNPDDSLVLISINMPAGVNLEKLRMQGPLKKTEHQFLNSDIYLR